MSELILIDTSVWIEAFRVNGDLQLRSKVFNLLDEGIAAWCEMIRLELWNGARGRDEFQFLQDMEDPEALNVHLFSTTSDVWKLADTLARKARQKGFTIPAQDLLISACARYYHVEFLHKDRHFDQIKML